MKPKLERIKDENGKLPEFAWPGGYPICYMDSDSETICAECANNTDESHYIPDLQEWFIHWEGPSEFCGNCNKEISAAYGDPSEESKC